VLIDVVLAVIPAWKYSLGNVFSSYTVDEAPERLAAVLIVTSAAPADPLVAGVAELRS